MKSRRLTALLLVLCLVLPTMVSCGGKTPVDNAENASEAKETRAMHQVPQLDFNGETFHSYAFDWQGYSLYFYADEDNLGESAIFKSTTQWVGKTNA